MAAARSMGHCTAVDVRTYFDFAQLPHSDDKTAWCAAFVGYCLKRAGLTHSGSLLARSYLKWGFECSIRPYCIAVFSRPEAEVWQGHVGFVQGFGNGEIRLLGGNQHHCVNVRTFPRSRLLGTRWPFHLLEGE